MSTSTPPAVVSVLVPTFGRAEQLLGCLDGLRMQTRVPDEIVVVYRDADDPTAATVRNIAWVRSVQVDEPGQVAAIKAGLIVAKGEIIALIDDDAVARRDWLDRICRAFSDAEVGGVGGRDVVHIHGAVLTGDAGVVGVVTNWGTPIGFHHLGSGPARDVDVLKGCNCAYRREALWVPTGLRGSGAQVHNDLATSLFARMAGYRLLYDPAIVVDHFPGTRPRPSRADRYDAAYNQALVIGTAYPKRARRYRLRAGLIGHAQSPGLAHAAIQLLVTRRNVWGDLVSSQRATAAGLRDARIGALSAWQAPIDAHRRLITE